MSDQEVLLGGWRAPDGVARELFEFTVLWEGWECDDKGWVVEMDDGLRAIVMSNHGGRYVADPSELRERLAEYEKVAAATIKALEMVSDNDRRPKGRDTK